MALTHNGGPLAASTAEAAASFRAVAARDPDLAVPCNDTLAEQFVPLAPRLTSLARVPGVRRAYPAIIRWVVPEAYGYETARLNEMDAVLLRELEAGTEQLLVLGAGYDTRVHRFASRLWLATPERCGSPSVPTRS